MASGKVHWADIKRIYVHYISHQRMLMIEVKDAKAYISRHRNSFMRMMLGLGYRMNGTPVSISANALQISFDELYLLIDTRFRQWHSGRNPDAITGNPR